jgi:hypothetical protein
MEAQSSLNRAGKIEQHLLKSVQDNIENTDETE